MQVELSPNELRIARFVARQRDNDGKAARADENKHGNTTPGFELHLIGCLGEMAFAKAMNLYWSGAGDHYYDDSDVGNYQIRTTKHAHGSLLVRPHEEFLLDPWVLVVQEDEAKYDVKGWIYGQEAHDEQYRRAPNGRPPAFFVPQSALRPMQTIPRFHVTAPR